MEYTCLASNFGVSLMTNHKSLATEKPVWFITGCSTGFGHQLAKQLLERGYRTVITARKPETLNCLAGFGDALALTLDVTDPQQIDAAILAAKARFGQIDVLVNNAGIGYFAAVEESEEAQIRKMFEINFFGLSRMIHAVLPGMRKQQSGYIINFSSLAGIRGCPALGYYNATKFAVEGLSEALWQEVEPLGIKVMLVEPSGFRTDWAGRSANESQAQIKDYLPTAGVLRSLLRTQSGQQPGDPVRGARAIIQAIESTHPPHHLLLGKDAFVGATNKLAELREEFLAGELVARSADFPKDQQGLAA
jgi:NADP-dependent 3-hydroxy acid dehydrogenase YdfG